MRITTTILYVSMMVATANVCNAATASITDQETWSGSAATGTLDLLGIPLTGSTGFLTIEQRGDFGQDVNERATYTFLGGFVELGFDAFVDSTVAGLTQIGSVFQQDLSPSGNNQDRDWFQRVVFEISSSLLMTILGGDLTIAVENGQSVGGVVVPPHYWQATLDIDPLVPPSAVVPIPAALWLMGSGFAGLMAFSRKLKKPQLAA